VKPPNLRLSSNAISGFGLTFLGFDPVLSDNSYPSGDLVIDAEAHFSQAPNLMTGGNVNQRKLIGVSCVAAVLIFFVAKGTAESPSGPASAPSHPSTAAATLVREVVYNELHDHDTHGYWRYWIEHHSNKETRLDEQIETVNGPVARTQLTNGRPLSSQAQEEEDQRLEHLLTSPSEQAQHRKEYADDEHRIARILALLPDAFLYEPAQEETLENVQCYHFHFSPNPAYPAHSIESRIFHAMTGDLWVSVQQKRLVRLDGQLQDNVDFGYGILGRLYKNGWFRLERTQVTSGGGSGDWKTQRLEVHMAGRAMLFKTIARETSEVRSGFTPVPASLSLDQAAALLHSSQVQPANAPHAQAASLGSSLMVRH
jgi:hypothetical protein